MEIKKKCPDCSGSLWVIANYLYISFHEGQLPLTEENVGLILYVATMSRQLWGPGNSLSGVPRKHLLNLPSELRPSGEPEFCRAIPIRVNKWLRENFTNNSYEVNGLKMFVGPTRRKISWDYSYKSCTGK